MPIEKKYSLRFFGGAADQHRLPAYVLAPVLEGLQRAVHLLALDAHGVNVTPRDRPSAELSEMYTVMCSVPEPGSFLQTFEIASTSNQLFPPERLETVAGNFEACLETIAGGNVHQLRDIVPDHIRRGRLISAFEKASKKPRGGVQFEMTGETGSLAISSVLRSHLREFKRREKDIEDVRTITGLLSAIDFDARKITVFYPPTGRELDCIYSADYEDLLLMNPRDYIHVTGRVVLDDEDHPKKITDVEGIQELDLSPCILSNYIDESLRIRFKESISVDPKSDQSKQILFLEYPVLGIDVYGSTREELDDMLVAEISNLWLNYAKESDEVLTPKALELKRALLGAIEEVSDAA